jgi:hypothetical protein
MVRSVVLLVCAAACGSVSASSSDASVGFLIEAESYSTVTMPMTYHWDVKSDQMGYTGSGFMQGLPATGAGCTMGDVQSCAPSIGYRIEIAQAGVYFFQARVFSSTLSDDSIWYGIDGARDDSPMFFGDPRLTWHWKTGNSFSLQAGPHTLNVWLRDPGARVDAVALTTSSQ